MEPFTIDIILPIASGALFITQAVTIWGYITNYTLTAEKQHMPLI